MMNTQRVSAERPAGPLMVAGETMGAAEDLIRRMRQIIDRLVGPAPESVGEAYPPAPEYLLPALDMKSRSLSEAVAEGSRALDRLESVL